MNGLRFSVWLVLWIHFAWLCLEDQGFLYELRVLSWHVIQALSVRTIVKYTGKLWFVQETQKQSLHQHLKIAQQFFSEEKEVIGLWGREQTQWLLDWWSYWRLRQQQQMQEQSWIHEQKTCYTLRAGLGFLCLMLCKKAPSLRSPLRCGKCPITWLGCVVFLVSIWIISASKPIFLKMCKMRAHHGCSVGLQVFNWKKSKLGWEANPKEYAKMISFAGRISQPQLALELFNEMETRGIKKTAVSYNALIHACGRNDEADKALRLFEEMKNTDTCQPTLVTYNTLISMYSRLGLTDNMKKIFEMCKEAGFSPDRHTYNALIWGFMRAGQLDQMESTVKELHTSECKADVITYNAQIIGYARANAVDKMEAAFTSMQRSGIPINAMVGEILAEVYSRMRMFEKMENTLKIMDDTPGQSFTLLALALDGYLVVIKG